MLEYAHCLPTVLGFVVFDPVLFGKEDGRRFLAFANLPLLFVSLLVSHPARVAALESPYVHTENEHVDPVIAISCSRIDRCLRSAGLGGVPWPNPWLNAFFKFGDDAVCEFLHRIAVR